MSHIPNVRFDNAVAHEQVEAAMQRARVIRSEAFASFLDRLWGGLKHVAGVEPKRIVRAIRPLTFVFGRPAPQANASRPVTAAELRAVFGAPANASGGVWRKSA